MSSRAWAAFATVSTLWGTSYLFIKLAIDAGVPPAFLAWTRVTIGAVVLLGLAWRAGALAPLRGRGRWLALYAIVEIAIPFPLIATGEQHVASSLAAVIIASVPLIVALLALRFDPAERATGRRLIGLLIGLSGVVALVGIDASGHLTELIGAAVILVAAVGYAIGPMVLKRTMADLDPRATMGATLAIASVVLAPLAAWHPPHAVPSFTALFSLLILSLFCTAAAFALMAALVAEIGAGRAVVITYINPIVAVALGVAILHERPGAGAVAGLLLILAGSWLATDGRLPPGLSAVVRRARDRRRRARSRAGPVASERDAGIGTVSAWVVSRCGAADQRASAGETTIRSRRAR